MAARQLFGLLLAIAAGVVGWLAWKQKLGAVWAAASGQKAVTGTASAGVTAGGSAIAVGAVKYVSGMGKQGLFLQQVTPPGAAPAPAPAPGATH